MPTIAEMELGFARLSAALGPCAHPDAVPVEALTGEVVAWLCPAPDCGRQLPATWAEVASAIASVPSSSSRNSHGGEATRTGLPPSGGTSHTTVRPVGVSAGPSSSRSGPE